MKKLWVLLFCLIAAGSVRAQAQSVPDTPRRLETRIYGLAEYYQWKETKSGEPGLKESGPLGGWGGEVNLRLVKGLWLEFQPLLYGGAVDYDGQTLRGTPVKSKTSYVGFKGNLDLAYRIPVTPHTNLKPFVGVGGRIWKRSLDKSLSESEVGEHGYDEYWKTVYGILGLGGSGHITERFEVFGTIGVYIPIWNENDADMSANGGYSSIKVTPGRSPYVAAEIGANYRWLSVSLFVETLKFSESDTESHGFYQPDSEAILAGLKLGAYF